MGIFGPNRDTNGDWRRLHSEELHSAWSLPNIASVIICRRLTCSGYVDRMEGGKLTGKRPFGRTRLK
jgi:hypothetical protein